VSFPLAHPHLLRHIRHDEAASQSDRRRLGLVVLCGAMFISAVDSTIVNIALPDISQDLNAGVGELQWVLDGFLVCLAGTLLVGSGLADHFGRRRVFLAGFAGFAATSVLAALAQTPNELIAARVLMGASAACVLPPALSLIAVMFTPKERPGALAVWASVAGVGLAAGPILGGVLVPALGWQSVFLVNVPFAIAAVPLGLRSLPESRRPGAPPLDLVGAALSIVSLASIVFTLIEGVDVGWTSPEVITTAVLGVGSGIAFVRVELRRRYPLFDVRVLLRPAVIAGAVAIVSMYIAFLGVLFLLPQYLQYVHDRSPFATAVILCPLGLGTIVTARFNERVLNALGMRLVISGGLVAMAGSIALLLLLGSITSVVVVMVSMGLFGGIIPLTIAPATAVIMDDLGEEKAGDGGAVNQLARQVGGALGVAVLGSVFAGVYANRIDFRLAALSHPARDRAAESIEEARDVVSGSGGALHQQLLARIDDSFDVAARVSFGVAVALLLVAAVVSAVSLAARDS
jgi:DHA2 family multidrug resistance protein-like MFS transporter